MLNLPIPNDPLNRSWVELSGANPVLVSQLRPALVAFLAFNHGREPRLAGSGFIITATSGLALVITAKHVLTEGVLRIQKPVPSHAASALFIQPSAITPTLNPDRLKIVWMGEQSSCLLNVAHACYNDNTDIAACVITSQESHPPTFPLTSIPLETTVPSVGDLVHMVSLDGMDVAELSEPTDHTGLGQMISITRRVSVRIGTVTAVYPSGFRQYAWPCFTTSIPAEPGMSGGFVYLPVHGAPIAACGIVCADNSSSEARSDNFQCGESVVACAWPALALRVPESIPSSPTSPTRTLIKMMQMGNMEPAVGGISHIRIVDMPNGDCVLSKQ